MEGRKKDEKEGGKREGKKTRKRWRKRKRRGGKPTRGASRKQTME